MNAAGSCGVLSDSEFRELEDLYGFRNVIIHRFAVSGVSYSEIGPKLDAYEMIYRRIFEQLREIEKPDTVELPDEQIAAARETIARKLTGTTDDRTDSAGSE